MVRTLSARLDALAPDHTGLAGLLDRFTPILEAMSVRSTIVHGDFAPWNLRLNHGRISAFDWEYAELDGLPLIDEAHYTLQLGYLLHNWSIDQAAQALHEFAESRPLSLEPVQVRAILAVYILDQLARLLAEGYPVGDDMVSWYRKLLLRIEAPTEQGVLV
jgi:Ser/Thr protein kinase RdoA (MazF antagonist)